MTHVFRVFSFYLPNFFMIANPKTSAEEGSDKAVFGGFCGEADSS